MTFTQVRLFLSAAQLHSFSDAAMEMYISQSAFSKQIKKLETEIGFSLFNRSGNKITLTPAGEVFKDYAVRFLDEYEHLRSDLAKLSMEGSIKFGTLPLLFDYNISDVLCSFGEKMPSVHIDIQEKSQNELLDAVRDGRLDFSVMRLDRVDTDEFDTVPLISDPIVLVSSAKLSKKLKKTPYSLSELQNTPFVLLGKESDLFSTCMNCFEQINFRPKHITTTSRHLHLLAMVRAGKGIGVLPRQMVNPQIFPDLQIFPFFQPIETAIGLVYSKKIGLSPLAQSLYSYFQDNFS